MMAGQRWQDEDGRACSVRRGVWRVACGVWRVACGVWRVELKAEITDGKVALACDMYMAIHTARAPIKHTELPAASVTISAFFFPILEGWQTLLVTCSERAPRARTTLRRIVSLKNVHS